MQNAHRTVLTSRQREILIKNHGSIDAAWSHIREIEALTDKAAKMARDKRGEVDPVLFHRTMEAMRRERGLWSD